MNSAKAQGGGFAALAGARASLVGLGWPLVKLNEAAQGGAVDALQYSRPARDVVLRRIARGPGYSAEASRGDAAAADVEIPRRRVARTFHGDDDAAAGI